jgi:hypothetical protein
MSVTRARLNAIGIQLIDLATQVEAYESAVLLAVVDVGQLLDRAELAPSARNVRSRRSRSVSVMAEGTLRDDLSTRR